MAHAVWAEAVGQAEIDVVYARRSNNAWEEAVTVSLAGGANLTPALAVDDRDRAWIVWVERGEGEYALHAAVVDDGAITALPDLPLPHSQNYAPSLVMDRDGAVWAAWSSLDETDEDIYASHFHNGAWAPPQRVHADNALPDIMPEIVLNNQGQPRIRWRGFNGDWFALYQVDHDDLAWGERKELPEGAWGASLGNVSATAMPARAARRLMGAMVVKSDGGPISFSDRETRLPAEGEK